MRFDLMSCRDRAVKEIRWWRFKPVDIAYLGDQRIGSAQIIVVGCFLQLLAKFLLANSFMLPDHGVPRNVFWVDLKQFAKALQTRFYTAKREHGQSQRTKFRCQLGLAVPRRIDKGSEFPVGTRWHVCLVCSAEFRPIVQRIA